MKKLLLTSIVCLAFSSLTRAQFGPIVPKIYMGVKAGLNFTALPANGIYDNKSEAGYIGGVWARFGATGFIFQPELYLTSKDVNITDNANNLNKARFTSLDLPLLVGDKFSIFDIGARIYTGPVVSFGLSDKQDLSEASSDIVKLNYKKQNYAWQFGGGLDLGQFSGDLRYEAGLNKYAYGPKEYSHTHVNVITLTLAYRLLTL